MKVVDSKQINMSKNLTEIKTGAGMLIAGMLLLAGTAMAASFAMPTANFPGNNAELPLQTSTVDQVKVGDLSAGNVSGYNVKGSSQVCIGSDCRSSWPSPSGSTLSTTCRWEYLILEGNPHVTQANVKPEEVGRGCDNVLGSRASEGWINVAHDKCPGVQGRDCAGVNYCQYLKLTCDAGLTFSAGEDTLRDTGGNSSGGSSGNGSNDDNGGGNGPRLDLN